VPLIACPIFDFTVFISLLLKFISPQLSNPNKRFLRSYQYSDPYR
jgi:hypothetical protein